MYENWRKSISTMLFVCIYKSWFKNYFGLSLNRKIIYWKIIEPYLKVKAPVVDRAPVVDHFDINLIYKNPDGRIHLKKICRQVLLSSD